MSGSLGPTLWGAPGWSPHEAKSLAGACPAHQQLLATGYWGWGQGRQVPRSSLLCKVDGAPGPQLQGVSPKEQGPQKLEGCTELLKGLESRVNLNFLTCTLWVFGHWDQDPLLPYRRIHLTTS